MDIFTNSKFDFIGKRWGFAVLSLAMVTIALTGVVVKGFRFGVEFTGGTQITARFSEPVTIAQIRSALEAKGLNAKPAQLGDAEENSFLIRVEKYYAGDEDLGVRMRAALIAKFGEEALRYWAYDPELGDRAEARIEQAGLSEALITEALAADQGLAGVKFERVQIDRTGTVNIQLQSLARDVVDELKANFHATDDNFSIEAIGPGVSRDLKVKGFLSLIVACILILGYVWFRFDMNYAPGAVVALAHDATITAGVFAWLGMEFNVTTVAALLAIIGYSVNDTVVVYDRIRENVHKYGQGDMAGLVNRSINEMLSRTVLTSATTLCAVSAIWLMGGSAIKDFGFAMVMGVVIGTYSSVYVAGAMVLGLFKLRSRQSSGSGAKPATASGRS